MTCCCGISDGRGLLIGLATFGAIAGGTLWFANTTATAQPEEPAMSPEEQAWMMAGTPGEMHAHLEPLIGTFDAATVFWMEPGAPPTESKGLCVNVWVLDGRFVKSDFTADMMGMPFTGIGYMGYDNIRKKYVGTWMDTMSTMFMDHEGDASADHKTFTMHGPFPDPMGNINKDRHVTRVISNDKHVFEMYHTGPDGKEMKVGEITYTRRPGGAAR